MLKIDNVKMEIGFNLQNLTKKCAKILKIDEKNIKNVNIHKQSIDARHKSNVFFVVSALVELKKNLEEKFPLLKFTPPDTSLTFKPKKLDLSPVVVGFGPSGIFASLALARMGLKPIIIEQGKKVDEREKDVLNFWQNRVLNKHSNVQFGEGGAGTFSDGKLNSNISNIYTQKVIQTLFEHGAPKEICYLAKPHIGSDNLKKVVSSIREEIISLGGKFYFSTLFEEFLSENNQICGAKLKNLENNEEFIIKTHHIFLGLGHSQTIY